MHAFRQDLQYAFRQLRKSPAFTITAILTFSIGIGVNTASFSIMDAVVLHPLGIPSLDRVVTLREQQSHGDSLPVALANFEDWQQQTHAFATMAVRSDADMSLTGAGDAAHVHAIYTTPSLFAVMQSSALLGRTFDSADLQRGQTREAVLSYAFWKSHWNADPNVLGRKVELDGQDFSILGVLPKAMQYPATADLFLPLIPNAAQLADRSAHEYAVLGRLASGVSLAQAQAQMDTIAAQLAQAHPATNQNWTVKIEPLLADINGELTPLYFSLAQGATLFVFLVVCANIANLQFARGILRRPEIALRTALGASRKRVLRQLLTENILLGLVGGAGGLLFASLDMHVTEVFIPERVARLMSGWSNISLSPRVLIVSLLLAVGAGILSGLAPALQALRVNLVDQLKSGSRSVTSSSRSRKLRNALAAAQISLAVALVIGATLMCKGMLSMLHMADQYQPAQTLTFSIHLPPARYGSPEKLAAWYDRSLEGLRALPGVDHAEVTAALPSSDDGWLNTIEIENRPLTLGKQQTALRLTVSGGYFQAFHIAPAAHTNAGRLFNPGDALNAPPVTVVSSEFVARYFPHGNPLGHRIRLSAAGSHQTPWIEIIGVVEETDYSMWERSHPPAVYLDAAQFPNDGAIYTLHTSGDPLSLAPAARKALAALDPALPLDEVETYAAFMHERLTGMFFIASTLGLDAGIALLLGAIGIFGAMANLVSERTREIGVRLALGARREDVFRMVLRRAGLLTGAGMLTGLLLALGMAHTVANLLYHVQPDDPVIFATITIAIALIALIASWLPASRAARIDPIVALRDE